jgi:peptide/nickel transport system substrate-binding protein
MRRDVDKERALPAQTGTPNQSFTLSVANSPTLEQIGQMIQSMASEAASTSKFRRWNPRRSP